MAVAALAVVGSVLSLASPAAAEGKDGIATVPLEGGGTIVCEAEDRGGTPNQVERSEAVWDMLHQIHAPDSVFRDVVIHRGDDLQLERGQAIYDQLRADGGDYEAGYNSCDIVSPGPGGDYAITIPLIDGHELRCLFADGQPDPEDNGGGTYSHKAVVDVVAEVGSRVFYGEKDLVPDNSAAAHEELRAALMLTLYGQGGNYSKEGTWCVRNEPKPILQRIGELLGKTVR